MTPAPPEPVRAIDTEDIAMISLPSIVDTDAGPTPHQD
jgi:hypothetical protein